MGLIENPQQIKHLLEFRAATLAYSDTFFRDAVKQNYSKMFLCNNIARVPVTGDDKPFPASFILRKNSEFTKLFNYGILLLKERGLHARYYLNFDRFQTEFSCDQKSNIFRGSVDITDIHVPFGIFGGGIVLSLLVFGYKKLMLIVGKN
jgi:hypothetical protein